MNTMQDKLIEAGVVAPTAPASPMPASKREVRLLNPTKLEDREQALQLAREAEERTFDLVHFDRLERRKNAAGVEYERRTPVYERFTFRAGRLEAYLLSDPRLGLTFEEREVMFGARLRKKE